MVLASQPAAAPPPPGAEQWRDAVIDQIYPRSNAQATEAARADMMAFLTATLLE